MAKIETDYTIEGFFSDETNAEDRLREACSGKGHCIWFVFKRRG